MGCQWALLVLLAHVGNLEMIGVVVLAFAVCAPLNALAQLGLRSAVVTDARQEFQFGHYLALRLITATLALLAVAAIVFATGAYSEAALIILIVGITEWFKSISDIFHALLQQHERMDRIAISQMIRGLSSLALLALGVALTGQIAWGMAGFPLAAAATLLAFDLPNGSRMIRTASAVQGNNSPGNSPCAGRLRPCFDAQTLTKLAWLTLPLGIVLMLIALTASVPRYMISHYLGNRSLGVFVSIFYLAMAGSRVVTAIGQSAGPRFAKYHVAGNTAAYVRLLVTLAALVAGLGVVVVLMVGLFGGAIFHLLYDADFTRYGNLPVWLTLAGAVMYLTIPLGIAVEAKRRFKTHMVIRGAGVLVLVGLLPGLLARYGLEGAAVAMGISFTCSMLGCLGVILWLLRHDLIPKQCSPQAGVEMPL